MIRVLQLIDSDADFQTRRCVEHLGRSLGEEFPADVRTIGRRNPREFLAALRELRRTHEQDLLHVWGGRALTAAALATTTTIVYTPPLNINERGIQWLTAIQGRRDVQVICPSGSLHRALVSRGVPLDKCHIVRPGVDFSRIRRRRDPQLRAALGFSEKDYVLLAAGESTRAARHEDAVWAAGILHKLDEHYRLLLWGRGDQLRAVSQFDRQLGNEELVCLAEQRLGRPVEFEELLPAADMIVNSSVGSIALLPIQIAMAAALPIVSTATYTTSELLEDRHSALLVPKRSPRLLAQRILELREDSALQWRLADTARAEAYEYFSLTHFLDAYRRMYRQLCSASPQPQPQ